MWITLFRYFCCYFHLKNTWYQSSENLLLSWPCFINHRFLGPPFIISLSLKITCTYHTICLHFHFIIGTFYFSSFSGWSNCSFLLTFLSSTSRKYQVFVDADKCSVTRGSSNFIGFGVCNFWWAPLQNTIIL